MAKLTWLDNVTWPKAVLIGGIVLIVTRLVAPDTAAWILAPIVDLTRIVVDAFRNTIGG